MRQWVTIESCVDVYYQSIANQFWVILRYFHELDIKVSNSFFYFLKIYENSFTLLKKIQE